MAKAIIIANIYTRKEKLIRLLKSMSTNFLHADYSIYIVSQGYGEREYDDLLYQIRQIGVEPTMIRIPELIGPHSARYIGLKRAVEEGHDIFCNLDDDVTILPTVNYQPIVERLRADKGAGFISGGWARSLKRAEMLDPINLFVKQPIIYTGGGLFYRLDVAKLILAGDPDAQWLFDDTQWSMTAYVNGYDNYRYRGSLVIAEVGNLDGRQQWVKRGKRELPDEKLINIRTIKANGDNAYAIPDSKDLTDFARNAHKRNIKK